MSHPGFGAVLIPWPSGRGANCFAAPVLEEPDHFECLDAQRGEPLQSARLRDDCGAEVREFGSCHQINPFLPSRRDVLGSAPVTGRGSTWRCVGCCSAKATISEIAASLFISQRTVDAHLSHIGSKFGVTDRVKLAVTAREYLTA